MDGPTAEMWKDMWETCPQQVLSIYNCLVKKCFPKKRKKTRVVLIRKPGKQRNSSSCFRPISLLDVAGKIYERLLAKRIKQHPALKGDLSGNQYGFTAGKSTIEATERVMQLIGMIKGGSRQTKEKCVVGALDVRNEFNTIAWTATGSYGQKMGISCEVPQ